MPLIFIFKKIYQQIFPKTASFGRPDELLRFENVIMSEAQALLPVKIQPSYCGEIH